MAPFSFREGSCNEPGPAQTLGFHYRLEGVCYGPEQVKGASIAVA